MSRHSPRGFTLLELMLYLAVVSAMLLIISVFVSTLLEARVRQQAATEVEDQARTVIHLVTQTIRSAQQINSPAAGGAGPSLSLRRNLSGVDPTVVDSLAGIIRIQEGLSSPVALTSSRVAVSSLSFENLSRPGTPGSVRVIFTLSHTNPGGRSEYEYSRNYYATASLR